MTNLKTPRWGALNDEQRKLQKAFHDVRVRHPKLDAVLEQIHPLLMPHSESNIVYIVGATGTGKSTLSRYALNHFYDQYADLAASDISAIPVVNVEAYCDGDTRHGFRGLYEDLRTALQEPATNRKTFIEEADGIMTLRPTKRLTIRQLRSLVEKGLKRRCTKVVVIDEAYHLLKFAKDSAVMDTLKSLANTTGTKLVLVGSFDLFSLVESHAQVARRSAFVHFERYRPERSEDCTAFRNIVLSLQDKWPVADVPNFVAIWDELMTLSLGCVGLLKGFLLDALAMQLLNADRWDYEFLQRAAMANKLRAIIEQEILSGEHEIEETLCGQSAWDSKRVAELRRRMEVGHA